MRWACAGGLLALLAGCTRAPPPEDPRTLYDLRCAPCHGAEGHGDGPAAAGRLPRPRDLSDPVWQARIDDAYLRKIIINGGLAVGLSTQMPGSPDLARHPESLEGLVRFVRGLRRPLGRFSFRKRRRRGLVRRRGERGSSPPRRRALALVS